MKAHTYRNKLIAILLIFTATQLYAENRQWHNFTYDKTGQLTLEDVVNKYYCLFVYDNGGNLLRRIGDSKIDAINSTKDDKRGTIFVYPNPAEETINIDFKEFTGERITLEIINTSGAIVLKQEIEASNNEAFTLNIQHLSTGHYTVRIKNVKGAESASFIKL